MISPTLPFEEEFDELKVIIDKETGTGTLYEICPDEFVEMGQIIGDRLSMDVIISDDEYEWLAKCWREATGRELKKPLILMLEEAVQEFQKSQDAE